jgi:2'-hydroxyisoflavone reductase
MDLLVLGGTRFVGRHIVAAALAAGHRVATFTRGNHPLPGTESLVGDRQAGDYAALRGRRWDAVIDVNAYVPRVVREAAAAIDCAHYTFVSTLSVVEDGAASASDEDAPLRTIADPDTEAVTGETYGGLKVLCEREAARLHDTCLVIRPHIVVGPFDPTGRFAYWPRRFRDRSRVLVPGRPEYTLQYIDARDQAAFVAGAVARGLTGTFNCAAPPVTWGALVEACGGMAKAVWVDEDWLADARVEPWTDLPLWLPQRADGRGLLATRAARALAAGLSIRPLQETVRDVLAHDGPQATAAAGLAPDAEDRLLEQYARAQGGGPVPRDGA